MWLIENQTFRLFVSVELNSRDPSYGWFLNWMARNVKHTQHLSVSTDLIKHDNGTVTTSFGFLPSTGDSYFYQLILFGWETTKFQIFSLNYVTGYYHWIWKSVMTIRGSASAQTEQWISILMKWRLFDFLKLLPHSRETLFSIQTYLHVMWAC